MTQQETIWPALLSAASAWALLSAVIAAGCVRHEMRWLAWGWTASFVLSSLIAAYSYWRLS